LPALEKAFVRPFLTSPQHRASATIQTPKGYDGKAAKNKRLSTGCSQADNRRSPCTYACKNRGCGFFAQAENVFIEEGKMKYKGTCLNVYRAQQVVPEKRWRIEEKSKNPMVNRRIVGFFCEAKKA